MPGPVASIASDGPDGGTQPTFDTVGMTTLTQLHKELTRVLTDRSGLSMTQYRILLKVGESDAAPQIGLVAQALGIGPSAATQAVDVLEGRGLVRRADTKADGRKTVIRPTRAGVDVVHSVDDAFASHLTTLWGLSMVGDEGEAYRSAIDAIGADIEGGGSARAATLVTSGYITSIEEGLRGAAAALRTVEGSTLAECRVLQCLNDADGRRRIGDLASTLVMASSTISHVIDRLTARDWARRIEVDGDRRSIDLEITASGEVARAAMRTVLDEFGRVRLWQQLSPRQAALTYEAARRLVDGLATRPTDL